MFLVGGVLTGVGASAIFRGSLGVALAATSRADERAGTLATFFKPAMRPSRYQVLGLGVALHYLTQVALLIFGLGVLLPARG